MISAHSRYKRMKARRTETTWTGKKNRFSTNTLELKIRSESASITQYPSAESGRSIAAVGRTRFILIGRCERRKPDLRPAEKQRTDSRKLSLSGTKCQSSARRF